MSGSVSKRCKVCAQSPVCLEEISFGGIPNSRNVLFLQIFLKPAAKPSAGNPLNLLEPDLALHQRFPKPSPRPSLQPSPKPVEPDLALHQGFLRASPEPSPEPCWTWPGSARKARRPSPGTFSRTLTWLSTKASQTFTGTFSGTLLNLTWLCTKASQTSGSCWTWPDLLRTWLGFAPGLPGTFSGFPEPCWTWPVSAPNPRPSREPSEPSPEPRWTWPGACTSAHRSYSGLLGKKWNREMTND